MFFDIILLSSKRDKFTFQDFIDIYFWPLNLLILENSQKTGVFDSHIFSTKFTMEFPIDFLLNFERKI